MTAACPTCAKRLPLDPRTLAVPRHLSPEWERSTLGVRALNSAIRAGVAECRGSGFRGLEGTIQP